jgi:outer membrane protein assembly factor BamB
MSLGKNSTPARSPLAALVPRAALRGNQGSIASCDDAQIGKMLYRQGLEAPGFFYASPVAANGNVYASSYSGVVVVFKAGDHCQVLARNNLGEQIVATPALVDGRVYVLTEGHLYAFGETQ